MCLSCWHDNLSQHFTVNDFVRSAMSINVLSPVLYAVAVAAAEKRACSTSARDSIPVDHNIEDFQPAHLREDGNLLRSFNPITFCFVSCFSSQHNNSILSLILAQGVHKVMWNSTPLFIVQDVYGLDTVSCTDFSRNRADNHANTLN